MEEAKAEQARLWTEIEAEKVKKLQADIEAEEEKKVLGEAKHEGADEERRVQERQSKKTCVAEGGRAEM